MKVLKWLGVMLLLLVVTSAYAQKEVMLETRLTRLDEGQKAIHQRIDDTNKRIDDLRADMNDRFSLMNERLNDMNQRFGDMNQRFDDMNRKFNWLYILIGAVITLNAAMVGSVVWLARQERPIDQRQYDQILDRQMDFERELKGMKFRLEDLEKARG